VPKSLSEMILDVSRHPASPDACATIICLNARGKPARADEHIASVMMCGSTAFRDNQEGHKVCKKCWTPEKPRHN